MTMTFDAALALTSPRVGAWDYQDATRRRLNLYTVGDSGAKLLSSYEFALEVHEMTNARLRAAHVRIGGTHRDIGFVWAMDDAGAAIWSDTARVFAAIDPVPAATTITRIVTFFGPTDAGHCGVRAEHRQGSTIVVEQHDSTPRNDPTYGAPELELDLEWAYYLGLDLALWLDVPHFDQFSDGVTNDELRRIAKGARELAAIVKREAAPGGVKGIDRSFGAMNDASELTLHVDRLDLTHSAVQLRATSKQSRATVAAELKRGPIDDVVAFLRQLQTATTVLQQMNALLQD